MDYQQSLKNFYHLKNFVRAWTECHIFFFFYSDTEYIVEIYNSEFTPEQQNKLDENLSSEFPYGYVSNERTGEEILYYFDSNITINYDLYSDSINDFICYDFANKKILQQQFFQLVKMLKNG